MQEAVLDPASGQLLDQAQVHAADRAPSFGAVLKALAKARSMGTGTSGRGPDVILYRGKAVDIKLTHSGSSNFAVTYINSDSGDLLVNAIGKYSGEVPLSLDPPTGWSAVRVAGDARGFVDGRGYRSDLGRRCCPCCW